MPIDPKFFNRFMIMVAAITAIIIIFSTLRHAQVNKQDFESEVYALDIQELRFERVLGTRTDSLQCGLAQQEELASQTIHAETCLGKPIILLFWATWSGMSQEMNQRVLEQLYSDTANAIQPANSSISQNSSLSQTSSTQNSDIIVIAAAIRDDASSVIRYSHSISAPFIYVDGTELFHQLKATGVPAQIFISREGTVTDLQIGRDAEALQQKIKKLAEAP
ncbi:MAG: TlpA family protein disulfide reductase [Balneolaceae bacterium]